MLKKMMNDILKKYTDNERPHSVCYDCRLLYKDFPADFMIQDELWEEINPTYHKQAGLLCPNCMCKRLIALGMSAVWVVVNTGEIKVKNNIITKIVNLWLNTWNRYRTWRCERWTKREDKMNQKKGINGCEN